MSIYKDKRSPFYRFDFEIRGHRFFGSSRKTSKREALILEKAEKVRARQVVLEAERIGSAPLTIDVAGGRYWTEIGKHHSASDTTWNNIEQLVEYFGKDKLLTEIKDDDVAKLIAWRRGQHVRGDPKRPLVSPATVNRSTLEPLKKIFNRAIGAWGAKLTPPTWKKHRLAEPEETARELKADDHEKIADELRGDLEPFFRFALASGLRLRECLLKWEEVDWSAGVIEKKGKGGRVVRVTISREIRRILWPLRGHHRIYAFTYQARASLRGRFKGARYPVTYEGVKSYWRRLKRRAGVACRFHDFRHDLGSKLLRATGNLRLVQKALNHRNIKTTLRYTHVLDDELRDGLDRVARARRKTRKVAAA